MTKFLFEKFTKAAGAFKESRVLLTANELDVFTFIEKKFNTSEAIAKQIKADRDALERLLNALCAAKFIVKEKNKYFNTALTSKFLVKGEEDYIGETLLHHSNLWRTWSYLTERVLRGQRFKNEALAKEKKSTKSHYTFIMAMHNNAKYKAETLANKINLKNTKTLIDIGGGPGTYAVYFARKNKNLNCVVYDLAKTTKITEKIIKKYNLEKRIKTFSGDFLKDGLPQGFDAAFLSSIVHIYNKEENIKLFKKVFKVLNPGGKIMIKDYIANNDGASPYYAALFSINMLVATKGGSVYTEKELTLWLREAGFKNIKRKNILDFSVLEGNMGQSLYGGNL